MRLPKISVVVSAVAVAAVVALPSGPALAGTSEPTVIATLPGAGSPLDAPLVNAMANGFDVLFGIVVSYDAVGPTGGLSELSSGTADFGTSEAPLDTAQLAACGACLQVAWAQAGVAVGYNLPGIGSKLHLTGPVLARIYLGRITKWNDSAIKALNPKLKLPDTTITPIHASSSGETYVFSEYLSKVDSTWRKHIGSGNDVAFPVGMAGAGDVGVTALLSATTGAVAYVNPAFLISHGLPAAAIENAAGRYEYPNLSNISDAAGAVTKVPADGIVDIIDPPATQTNAYPLSTFSYVVISRNASTVVKGALREWILYAIGLGKSFGRTLDYPSLPSAVVAADNTAINRFAPTF